MLRSTHTTVVRGPGRAVLSTCTTRNTATTKKNTRALRTATTPRERNRGKKPRTPYYAAVPARTNSVFCRTRQSRHQYRASMFLYTCGMQRYDGVRPCPAWLLARSFPHQPTHTRTIVLPRPAGHRRGAGIGRPAALAFSSCRSIDVCYC